MADLYDEMVQKAQFFKTTIKEIFKSLPNFKYVKNESIVTGFFFLFIYNDFVLRDVL